MNNKGLAKGLNRVFSILFFVIFGYLFISCLFVGAQQTANQKTIITFSFIIITILFFVIYFIINKSDNKLRKKTTFFNNKNTTIFIVIGLMVMFGIQLLMGYLLEINPITDVKIVNNYAFDFAKTGNFNKIQNDYLNNSVYLIRYPNNITIYLLLSFLYRAGYLLFGEIPTFWAVILNVICINISVLFTVLIARKIFGNKKAIFTFIICFLFLPYYTYAPYYYTDSISMPFVVISIYLFICATHSNKNISKYVMLFFSGVLLLIGFKLKGSVLIVLLVFLIYSVLKFNFKKIICFSLALIIGFCSIGALYGASVNSLHLMTDKQSYQKEYPITHWIYMGLEGHGGYHEKDSEYTDSFPNKDEKNKADIKGIEKRVQKMGADGLYNHLINKAMWTWQDGTYYISHHIQNPKRENLLHNFVLKDSKYYDYFFGISCGFQLMLLLLICISIFKNCIKSSVNEFTIFNGIIFATLIFFLIWETRSRYIYNFTPIFILTAVNGFDYIHSLIFFKKHKSNDDLRKE